MQKWSQSNERAKEARRVLVRDRKRGESIFAQLIMDEPRNGFIYFERAKAFEEIGESHLANSDYHKAKAVFPLKKWKDIAQEGVERTHGNLMTREKDDELTRAAALGIPNDLHSLWNDTMARLDAEPEQGCAQARTLLEKIIDILLHTQGIDIRRCPTLVEKIEALKKGLSGSIITSMQHVRKLGNEAAHGGQVSPDNARAVRFSLIALARGIFSKDTKF